MADLARFREQVTIYRKRQMDRVTERPYTQEALANRMGLSADELGHRLRGTGRSRLTPENVLAIVRTLAAWETLTWKEAVDLLRLMDYALDHAGWQTDLQCVLGPLPPSMQQFIASRLTSPGAIPAAPARWIFQARDLPKDYVPRPSLLKDLKRLLLAHEENQTTAITTALRGAGGFGKTTLASALCHDQEIQEAFADGILWVELGEHPAASLTVLNELLQVLESARREALTLQEARERWRKALEERMYLLVIDDVWQTGAMEELLQGGPQCGRLITTRNDQLLPAGAKRVWVDAMEPAEATALLCEGVIDDWQHTLDPLVLEQVVVQQLGCWPLLVSLARGMLKNQVGRLGKTPQQALTRLQHAYEERGMAIFHLGDRDERQRNVDASLEVSLRQLEEWMPAHYQARQRYLELAVFPEDTDIPLATLQIYWRGTGGLHEHEVEELCLHLADLSLLLPWNTETPTIRLHDVLRSYLIQRVGNQLPTLHQRLLDAHWQRYHLTRWADLSQSEAYLWQHLAYHLCQASNQEALPTILTDLLYVTRKVQYRGVETLEADLMLATISMLEKGDGKPSAKLASLHQTIRNISHLLRQVANEADIGGVLLSHLPARWNRQRQSLERMLPRPFFTAWHPLPHRSSPALIRVLRGHTSWVYACAISPDGKWIVSASRDNTLKVWDSSTGVERFSLRGHQEEVHACVYSPDGKWIVSASWDKTLKVWDNSTGALVRTLTGHLEQIRACGYSPDGRWIVSGSIDGTLKVWDSSTGAERLSFRGHGDGIKACGYSPDSQWIVSASWDKTLKVWDNSTGALVLTLTGHTKAVRAYGYSPDGRWIVSASDDHTLKMWDSSTGAEVRTLTGHTDKVKASRYSPDGKWIVSASNDRTLKVWDSSTGALVRTLTGHTDKVWACGYSPDGKWIVSASNDRTLKVWDSSTRVEVRTLTDHTSWVTGCAISPDGRWIVSASGGHTLKVWDNSTGVEVRTLTGHTDKVKDCRYSPDGRWIVSTSWSRTLKVWDVLTGAEHLTLRGHTREVNGCGYSPDGRWIVSASDDHTLKVWDSSTGAEVRTLTGHTSWVKACGYSPDGRWIVSASWDHTLKVWEATTGAELRTLTGHGHFVTACAFNPDGTRIVSASDDKTLKVWDSSTGAEVRTLTSHTDPVTACGFSPDGKWIVSASDDDTLKVWEAQSGQCVLTYPIDGALSGYAFHPDGKHLVVCGEVGLYYLRLVQ